MASLLFGFLFSFFLFFLLSATDTARGHSSAVAEFENVKSVSDLFVLRVLDHVDVLRGIYSGRRTLWVVEGWMKGG